MNIIKKHAHKFLFAAFLGIAAVAVSSCENDNATGAEDNGIITGIVKDTQDAVIEGVTVEVTGIENTTATNSAGSYTFDNVDVIARRIVTFSKAGYETEEITVKAAEFIGGVATVNATLRTAEGAAVITGTVTDTAGNPIADVAVTVSGVTGQEFTAADGTYIVENVPIIAVRTVTFSKDGYQTQEKSVKAADFTGNVAKVDAQMTKLLTITGTVTDSGNNPVDGVTVEVSGVDEPATTGADGKYTVENIPVAALLTVIFSKDGYKSSEINLTSADFTDSRAQVDIILTSASAKIIGIVLNASTGNPIAGITVEATDIVDKVTTGTDGTFTISNITEGDYTVTFSKAGYPDVVKEVVAGDFVDGVADLGEIRMESPDVLPGKTLADLLEGNAWLYNDYKSGANKPSGAFWSEFSSYLYSVANLYGRFEYQTEGLSVRIRVNSDGSIPVDTDNFDSYMYGRKLITDDNKILTLKVRTHDTTADAPAEFGVQVVDLSATVPAAVKVGENQTCNSSDYINYDFDLSDFIGKEVIVAIGIYRARAGSDYLPQLPVRAVAFTRNGAGSDSNWMNGTEVQYGWKLTREMVASTMVQTGRSFTGITPGSGNNGERYRSWYPSNVPHIAKEWGMIAVNQEPEPFPGEGFMLKTRNVTSGTVDSSIPESFFYAGFSIAEGCNKLKIRARTFSSTKHTYFRVSAVKDDYTVVHFSPSEVTNAASYEEAADNLVGFYHEDGGGDYMEGYAVFEYDLASLNGSDAVIVIGVYKSTTADDKMSFYSIEMN